MLRRYWRRFKHKRLIFLLAGLIVGLTLSRLAFALPWRVYRVESLPHYIEVRLPAPWGMRGTGQLKYNLKTGTEEMPLYDVGGQWYGYDELFLVFRVEDSISASGPITLTIFQKYIATTMSPYTIEPEPILTSESLD